MTVLSGASEMAAPEENRPSTPTPEAPSAKKRLNNKPKRPNYSLLHSKPLPLNTHPLPAFHPTHPISFLRLAYTYLSQLWAPPSSHPDFVYVGYFSPETRSINITDPKHARALWEMGFFGKGTLSRSEPAWLERERARLIAKRPGAGGTAEEATLARRAKRRAFKLERARAEAERIERQRLVEEGKLDPAMLEAEAATSIAETTPSLSTTIQTPGLKTPRSRDHADEDEEEALPDFENQEHLQLTLEESFFLSYALGVLQIQLPAPSSKSTPTNRELLHLFTAHSFFPPAFQPTHKIAPDDHFLLNYIVYHHFRSLGWVVRSGIKFSVDYLLYYRGPVFSHAEFAVQVLPAYSDPYWSTPAGQRERRVEEEKDWWWLHCINRVQSQVLKTLVMCYVEIPAPREGDGVRDIGGLLKRYTVREFVMRRWIANRNRD